MKMQGNTFAQKGGQWLLLTALAASLMACGQKNDQHAGAMPPVPVGVIEIAPTDVPVSFEFVGQAAGSREVEVRARVGGILLKRAYTEGKPVKQGDLLFQIDPEPLKATLDQAQGNLQVQQAQLVRTKQDYDRITPLFKENAVSQKDRDDAVSAYEAAKASVAAAQAQVQQAKINLGYARVTAPISGMTSQETRSEGSLVSTTADGSLLTKVSQLDPVYVNFSMSDSDMMNLRKMQDSGQLKLAANGHFNVQLKLTDGSTYGKSGRLNFTDSLVDASTGTIRSRATFANPDGSILPGQFVRVILQGAQRSNAIAVPQRAVLTSQQGKMVWVVGADNKVQPRPITVSQDVGLNVLVESGLKAGDKVVVDNIIKLRPGADVKPHPFKADASAPAAAPKQ
ncbi:membrane fusion protein (multidrug efflux system) [Chromobacterium alkanivorans]|uniref:efflux RND transporter periplasmic adaptor subunit n=1 Tax=Chromobacterium alkanivorans TaxID=1071719 RepID=UPI00216A6E12|nr:efflux RND transporter periplasmic adaptor subunit [Chromobacterium alkanivorans]MCS3803309.1 membrane fusion protein (multidrug efflux system) [Chromobacterium alkanivorans]MCS3817581.1 membrane fusion protein (multidrug efflux system) [Chromobacterium alkanivorans]MCS3872675.1 membrane fusion protein (multidrug efflux system) [Chromobacterium alkanivorans]